MKKFLCAVLGLLWTIPGYCECQRTLQGELYTTENLTSGYILLTSGTMEANSNYNITDYIFLPAGDYYFQVNDDATGNRPILGLLYDMSHNLTTTAFSGTSQPYLQTFNFTVSTDSYIRIGVRNSTTERSLQPVEPITYTVDCITIATTKYTETQFSPIDTALANAVAVVNTVVTNTINQAASIATLHANKQNRPADDSECPAGKKCLLVTDENNVPHWYEIVTSLLPSGYTQLEYIESTGTQYINTGVYSIVNLKTEIIAQQTEINTGFPTLIGAQETSGQYKVILAYGSSSKFYSQSGNGSGYVLFISQDTNKHKFIIENGTNSQTYIIDDDYTGTANYTITSGTNVPLAIFARKTSTEAGAYVKMKVWSVKFWQNNTLVRDFVPAQNASGVVGMYDTVSGTFFANAGTGTFVAGPAAE